MKKDSAPSDRLMIRGPRPTVNTRPRTVKGAVGSVAGECVPEQFNLSNLPPSAKVWP